jgi:hypothetical protein
MVDDCSDGYAYMLTEGSHNKSTFLSTTGVLEKTINYSLLGICASLSLTAGNLYQRLVNSLDRQRLWFLESEALFLLDLESYISGIAVLVINGF